MMKSTHVHRASCACVVCCRGVRHSVRPSVRLFVLRVAAPIFCKHVAFLFNISLATSTVAQQWKEASIPPVPKIAIPTQHSDFRPISITPILTRMMERTVVRTFLYPAFLAPPPSLTFSDQFAFRSTGSTSAAIISLLHTITSLLQANPYVIVISLNFSKAFDSVRHSTLLSKMPELDLPAYVYNWMVSSSVITPNGPCTTARCRPRSRYRPASFRVPALAPGPH